VCACVPVCGRGTPALQPVSGTAAWAVSLACTPSWFLTQILDPYTMTTKCGQLHAPPQVEQFRGEAQAASAALAAAVERTSARLQSEEQQLDRMRSDSAHQVRGAGRQGLMPGNQRHFSCMPASPQTCPLASPIQSRGRTDLGGSRNLSPCKGVTPRPNPRKGVCPYD